MTRYVYDQNRIDSRDVAYSGDKSLARRVLREYGGYKRWSKETCRVRWDGAAALLGWWSALPLEARPPLHQLSQDDARAFITSLEKRGLVRSTIKSYRVGADALTQALRWGWDIPYREDPNYAPFEGVQPKPKQRPTPHVDCTRLAVIPVSLRRTKLEALLALLALGLSVPEACEVRWSAIDLERRTLRRADGRQVTLGVPALQAVGALWVKQAKYRRDGYYPALGWSSDSARRWLKKVLADHVGV